MTYLLLKSLHIAAVLVFTGGLVTLAVVFAGWVRVRGVVLPHERSIGRAIMLWDRYVTVPALLLMWVVGLILAKTGGWLGQPWLLGKILLVVALSGLHGMLRAAIKARTDGYATTGPLWQKYVPFGVAASLVVIAVLVTIKPALA